MERGKHDKTILTSSEDFYENRIADLQERLAFANETASKLKTEVNKYNRWISEIQAAAQDRLDEKDKYIEKLEKTIIELAVRR